jgi:hypothetical protein
VGVGVKEFINICNKLSPRNIPSMCIFTPFPLFRIQIENNLTYFGHLISNAMQREIILHLGDPACGIIAIKVIDLNLRKTGVMIKGVGMKGHRMGGVNTIYLGGLFREGGILGLVQKLFESDNEGVNFFFQFSL